MKPEQVAGQTEIRKEPDKPTKEQCEYKSVAVAKPPVPSDQLSSAQGDDTDSTTGSGRLNSTYERAKALPASFDTFIKAIEHLNTFEGFSAKIREPDELSRYIPLTKPEGCWQWSYLESRNMTRRQVLIGDIYYQGHWFSLIEFEHRETDKCCLGKAFTVTGNYLTSIQIVSLLNELAEHRGVWTNINHSKPDDLQIDTYKHVWPTYSDFSKAVIKKISAISNF